MGEIKTEEEEKCQMGEKRRKATVRRQSKDGEKGRLSFNRVQSFDYFIKLDTVNNSTENAFFYFKGPKCHGTVCFHLGKEKNFHYLNAFKGTVGNERLQLVLPDPNSDLLLGTLHEVTLKGSPGK